MTPRHDWKALVADHARATGAADLPLHTIEELATHLEDIYNAKRAEGASEAGALLAARAALAESSLAAVPRSRTHPVESRAPVPAAPASGFTGLGGDLRFAWRQLRRSPSFAVVAIATLGLGAGAATAIFSIVDTVLLRPLPFRQPEQLVAIWELTPRRRCRRNGCPRSISWTTEASAPCSRTRPPGGAPRSICRSPAPNRSA